MRRLAVLARMKRTTADRARELVSGRRPFDLRALRIERNTMFEPVGEVVFVRDDNDATAPRRKTWA
jgi:hypothetical protein